MKVSQSKVKRYRECHFAYWLKYVLHLRRKIVKRPFQFGRIVHKMTEAEANADNPFKVLEQISLDNKRLFTAEKEMYGEIIKDIRCIMTEYLDYYRDDSLIYYRRNKRSAEHKLEIELEPGLILVAIIDAIARTPNGLRWIVERKTFSKAPNEEHRWRDLQSCIYIKALEIVGWPEVDGLCWDYIKSKPPTIPQMLKKGGLSKKKCDTLPSVVRETIKKHKLKVEDYKPLIKSSEVNLKNWFFRVYTPVHRNVVNSVFKDFLFTAREIAETHGDKKDKNIGRHCMWCDYELICKAELQDLDVDEVIRREYENYKEQESEKAKAKKKVKAKGKKTGGRSKR